MKRKYLLLVLSLILALAMFASCAITLDGYSRDVEHARKAEDVYKSYDYIFSAEHDNGVVDFLIDGESLSIVKIIRTERNGKELYKVKCASTFQLDGLVGGAGASEVSYWEKTWDSIIEVEFAVIRNDGTARENSFSFKYNGNDYLLLYRMGK